MNQAKTNDFAAMPVLLFLKKQRLMKQGYVGLTAATQSDAMRVLIG